MGTSRRDTEIYPGAIMCEYHNYVDHQTHPRERSSFSSAAKRNIIRPWNRERCEFFSTLVRVRPRECNVLGIVADFSAVRPLSADRDLMRKGLIRLRDGKDLRARIACQF